MRVIGDVQLVNLRLQAMELVQGGLNLLPPDLLRFVFIGAALHKIIDYKTDYDFTLKESDLQ